MSGERDKDRYMLSVKRKKENKEELLKSKTKTYKGINEWRNTRMSRKREKD